MDQETSHRIGVAVVGFPYVRESAFAVFRYWPDPEHIRFLLPRSWPIKGGKIVYSPPSDARITTMRAFFSGYHQHTPIIGGLLKGLMPAFPLFLWRNRKRIDLVYACSEPILLVTLYYTLWARLFRKKLVLFTWENISYQEKFSGISGIVHGALLRMNLACADGLLCGNARGAEIHRRLTSKPVAIVPMNGLEPEQFKRGGSMKEGLEKVIYVFVGAIGKRKGIQCILRAFPEVCRSIPMARLVIAGSGEYENEIATLINQLGIRERVTRLPWLGHQELVELLTIADVFLYPSIPNRGWAEQFGYSMAEASLMELPIIATSSGSINEVVKDGETGILVPPDDVSALVDAMVRLGLDEDMRKRMGQAGRNFIIEHFSNRITARAMHSFFAGLAARRE